MLTVFGLVFQCRDFKNDLFQMAEKFTFKPEVWSKWNRTIQNGLIPLLRKKVKTKTESITDVDLSDKRRSYAITRYHRKRKKI
jgi:hypothetical protein